MRTVAIISQKGGAGKTTLAVHLAAAAAAEAVSLIIDTDPQATASRWAQWRAGKEPEVIDCGAPSLLADKLAKAEALGAELVVIDTPPHADAMARHAAKLADLILVPCRPRAFDLAAIEAKRFMRVETACSLANTRACEVVRVPKPKGLRPPSRPSHQLQNAGLCRRRRCCGGTPPARRGTLAQAQGRTVQ